MKNPKPNCNNCKFASPKFYIVKKAHVHCENKTLYNQEGADKGLFNAWDTLREWWDKCNLHEYK